MNGEVKDEILVEKARNGDNRAMDELLVRYVGVVRSKARRFFLVGGETEDLIQEGGLGLTYAIRDYDGNKSGKSFKNFAYMCVSSEIIDAVKRANAKKNQPLKRKFLRKRYLFKVRAAGDGRWIAEHRMPP